MQTKEAAEAVDLEMEDRFQFSEANVQKLKQKYMDEMKQKVLKEDFSEESPIRTCMRIMFEAANERNPTRRAELAFELSKTLIRQDGLINLFLALIDFDTSSQKVTTHNQRFLAVANIIAYLPKLCLPYIEYCNNLRKQLELILVHHDTRYSSLASLIVKALMESPHARQSRQQVQEVLLDPFLRPLTHKVPDLQIHHSILAIHNLVQNQLPSSLFVNSFPRLFYALAALNNSPSQLKSYLKAILTRILNDLQPGPACCLLEESLFYETECDVYGIVTDDDQITLELLDEPGQVLDFEEFKQVVMDIIEHCDNELLVLEFFFHFQAKLWTFDLITSSQCASLIEPLLEETVRENQSSKLDLLTSIISNRQKALELIYRTLLNYLDFLRSHKHDKERDRNESQSLVNVSLSSCLDILEVLFATIETQTSVEILRDKIAHTLQDISLQIGDNKLKSYKGTKKNLDSLLEKLTNHPGPFQVPSQADLASREYNAAMRDLNDKLVPVRVHAIVRLKNLILSGDAYTVSRLDQLCSMIECSLADQEPYVFLASINLMAEMGLRKTDSFLPRLIKLYKDQKLDVQQRLNVGEVLVRLARRMYQMTPAYAKKIMTTFLEFTQSEEELIRISSLSNIGELCRHLGYSLGTYIVDIFSCAERILEGDTIQTKCAAVEMLRQALMGLDGLLIESIQREMKSIYRLLKKLQQKTLDEKLCRLTDLALDEIDRLAKEMLGCKSDDSSVSGRDALCKNLKILSLLD